MKFKEYLFTLIEMGNMALWPEGLSVEGRPLVCLYLLLITFKLFEYINYKFRQSLLLFLYLVT